MRSASPTLSGATAAAVCRPGAGRQATLVIRTPEGILFTIETASPVSRFLALTIDQACIYAASTVITSACGAIGLLSSDFAGAVWMVAWFALSIGYPILLEWFWRGQTLGKKLLRLRVMDVQALRLNASQVVVRNLLRFVDALPVFYLVGGAASLLNPRGQRLGDLAANTVVIQHPRLSEPDLSRLLPDRYNSFRAYPHLAARLRQNLNPREVAVLVQALLRRDALDDASRLALFEELKRHVESVISFPAEAAEGISAEQYVRNVVDLLFRAET